MTYERIEQMRFIKKKIVAFTLCFVMAISCILALVISPINEVNAEESNTNLPNNLVNYVVVDKPELTIDSTQIITIGVGNSELELKDAFIRIVNENTSEEYYIAANNKSEDAFSFEFGFKGCNEGKYRLTTLAYKIEEDSFGLDLQSAGFDIVWGVGVQVETHSDAKLVDDNNTSYKQNDITKDAVYTVKTKDSTYNSSKLSDAIGKVKNDKKSISKNADGSYKGSGPNGEIIVVLDPGHGGSDSGACANGIVEKDYNLLIATICQNELSKYNGVLVFKTRNDDSYVGLEERTDIAKFYNADIFVSIHLNSASPAAYGAEVYYPNESYNPFASFVGYNVSKSILNNITALGISDRGVKIRNGEQTYDDGSVADYYSVIRNAKKRGIAGIIVEHLFITNSFEAECLKNWDFLNALGQADAKGIAQAYNLGLSWNATGIYVANHSYNNYTCGLCVNNKSQSLDYRWLAYEYSTGCWKLLSDWKTNNEWVSWDPGKSGDYLIRCEVRQSNNYNIHQDINVGTHHNELIKGICQMPDYSGAGALIGMESQFASADYRYEISILDCSKLDTPTPWIYGTGILSSNKSLWTRVNIPRGYYWTLYRLYDRYGNIIDQECYGFENI